MTDRSVRVSIIVPVFNAEQTIGRTLHSLMAQSLHQIEIIAIDDASTDRSGEVLDQIATQEPRLHVIHLASNVGVHEARAAGLRAAKGAFIGFVDADDIVRGTMFQTLLEASVEHDADISICGADCISATGRKFLGTKVEFRSASTVSRGIFDRFCRLDFGTGALWNKLYRRELILDHALRSFRWRQNATEDTLVNIGCFMDANRVRLVKETLYGYVLHPESATQAASQGRSFSRILLAYAAALDTYQHRGADVVKGITGLYARQLQFDCYRVESLDEIAECATALTQAVRWLADQYPIGLAFLAGQRRVSRPRFSPIRAFGTVKRKFMFLGRSWV